METWDPSVKIFYPIKKLPFSTEISAEFCRHCALSGWVSPERRNENIKYFIPSNENWTHNRRVSRSILGPLRHDGLIYKYESYTVWSFITLVYKGRGSVEDCSSYKGIKLTSLTMKVFKRRSERTKSHIFRSPLSAEKRYYFSSPDWDLNSLSSCFHSLVILLFLNSL